MSWATAEPSGMTTPASRAAEVTIPMSLWCRASRKPGVNSRASMFGALAVQHGAAGQAAAEHLQRGLHVHAVRLEEDDRLGEQLDVAGDDQLVRGLDGLPGARGPDVHDRLADGVEHGLGGLEVGGLAADHDREAALDRAGLAAADRGVEYPQPGLAPGLGHAHGDVRADRAHVDVERAGLRGVGEDPVVAAGDGLDVRRVGHHRDDHVGVPDGLRDVLRAAPAGLDEPLHGLRAAVVPDHLEAGLDQVGGHRAAHDAQADEGDGRHVGSTFRGGMERKRLSQGLPPTPLAPFSGPTRRARGSQSKASALAPLGLYSSPTQPS